jgi:phosphoglycerate-specific signal transduction histidine kinase
MSEVTERLARLEESNKHIIKKLDDTKDTIGKIFDKLDGLTKVSERVKELSARVNWLYFAFTVVVITGIVIGVWIKGV